MDGERAAAGEADDRVRGSAAFQQRRYGIGDLLVAVYAHHGLRGQREAGLGESSPQSLGAA